MRLTPIEIEVIKKEAQKCFGDSVEIYLFGSRTKDNEKGGDIDE